MPPNDPNIQIKDPGASQDTFPPLSPRVHYKTGEKSPDTGKHHKKESWLDLGRFALIALIVVVGIRFFIAKPFLVSGSSMHPTFENGEYLIVDELSYRFEAPHRGDVIIFKYPKDETKFYIKRIVALPYETIESREGKLSIKNTEHPEGFSLDEPYIKNNSVDSFKVTLGNEYFVMGDNRTESSDSRFWGPLKRSLIIGRPFVRLHPFERLSVLPGGFEKYLDAEKPLQ